jgi:ABC-2 type transport system permease protein
MRMVLLKGAGLNEIKIHLVIIFWYALIINGFAVWSYKKVI